MAKPTENKEDKNPNKATGMDTNTLMILNNIIVIVVLIVSLITTYFLLDASFDKKLQALAPQEESYEEEGEVKQEGILLDLGDFILNLVDASQRRYLKVGVAIELSKTEEEIALANAPAKASGGHGGHGAPEPTDPNAEIIAQMERYKPAIRDAVISVLSNKSADELSSPTGKEIAKEEIKESVNGIFEGEREAMRVSFGQFIIQ